MATVELPDPVAISARQRDVRQVDLHALEAALDRRVDGEVRFDTGSRAAYATDASNYRIPPVGVVVPRSVDAAVEAVAVCREHGAPLLSRGAGTSLAGQTANSAVVIDWSKYCHRLVSLDVESRTCVVEPGMALDALDGLLAEHGLTWGPQPATHWTCTVGGMIGNNSCGASAQRYGKVADNVRRLEILLYDGTRMWVGPTSDDEYAEIQRAGGRRAEVYRELRELRDRELERLRTGYPDIPRRVSGYNLDALLPEHGFDVARAIIGSEGTLATILRAELALSELPRARRLVVLGYPDVVAAARAVPDVVRHGPHRLEAVDSRLATMVDQLGGHEETLEDLTEGRSWLLAEFTGNTDEEAVRRAERLVAEAHSTPAPPSVRLVHDADEQGAFWDLRESALAATAHPSDSRDTWPGWEDSAVDPEDLGDYLAELSDLLERFEYADTSALYGHFGQGCVHLRIPFPLRSEHGAEQFRRFVEEAADLVIRYGGSYSGEHGDGQARGELLSRMFGPDLVRDFAAVKVLLDPDNRMNPGKVVAPYPLDADLRLGPWYPPWEPATEFGYPEDDGSFANAALRCVGVGKCRSAVGEGHVMCPSYQVTGEEEHSTRGRARLLFEMLRGDVITDGWRSRAVRRALDLCLACKGCKSDCPVEVDMATYKAEFLHHHYRRRLRPRAHYSMGWLPVAARLAGRAPAVVNAMTHTPLLRSVVKRVGGIASERELPLFASERFSDWYRRHEPQGDGRRGDVMLWPDTFTEFFHPHVGMAAVRVLEHAGFRVRLPEQEVCCGLTWISTGQLRVAKRVLRRTVEILRPALDEGIPIVGLEPSCTAVLRNDAHDLMPDDEDVSRVSVATKTLSELLLEAAPDWQPPSERRQAMVQTHCHQHAVLGVDHDRRLMDKANLDAEFLDAGCCGLAGNFGFEAGHYDVSMACAEQALLPRLREGDPAAMVLADGFSCRTQVEHGQSGRRAVHLAEALAGLLDGTLPENHPEDVLSSRPQPPSRVVQASTLATTAAVAGATLAAAVAGARRHSRAGSPTVLPTALGGRS